MKSTIALISLILSIPVAYADSPRSADYTVTADSIDGGGQRSASALYSHDGSVGGIIGISTVASPAETAKSGYIGQLYEVAALQVSATPTWVNEGETRQLSVLQLLDDDSLIPLDATDVTWSVMAGPFNGITANGLASAALVYADTVATAKADFAGATGTRDFLVFNSNSDNFGSYAGDGLPDDWQFLNFGLNNPLAGPLLDPDGDGQNNGFEFTAGLDPTDPFSVFSFFVAKVPGQPEQKKLVFNPIVAGRNYTVMTSPNLNPGSWVPLSGGEVSDDGDQRTVTDTSSTEAKKFYTVDIVKP